MAVTLRRISRENYEALLALKLAPGQERFVSSPVRSLADAYIGLYGPRFEYCPNAIYQDAEMVGYVTTVSDPASTADYWIDDIMIDAPRQGQGLGRQAMFAAIGFILARYPRCAAIRLTCHRENERAARLYLSLGFVNTGRTWKENFVYELTGSALEKFRSS